MKKNSQNQQDYTNFDKDGNYKKGFAEINSGEILTLENESFTIREMIDKWVTGIFDPKSIFRNQEELEYTDDMMDSEVPEFIDRTDVEEYVQSVNVRKKRAENALNDTANKIVEKEADAKDDRSKDDKKADLENK